MIELRERTDRAPDSRCPYCHDLMAVDAVQVVCGGCGTQHHAACLDELGRCTVLGCAWTPPGAPPRPPETRSVEDVRAAVRERVRGFVREHVRPTAPSPRFIYGGYESPRLGLGGRVRDFFAGELGLYVVLFLIALMVMAMAVTAQGR